jgi:hypothetical protein
MQSFSNHSSISRDAASGNAKSFACQSFEVMPPAAMLSYLPAGVLVITAASQGMPSLLPAGVLK